MTEIGHRAAESLILAKQRAKITHFRARCGSLQVLYHVVAGIMPQKRVDRVRNFRESSSAMVHWSGLDREKRWAVGGVSGLQLGVSKHLFIGDNLVQVGPIGKDQSLLKLSFKGKRK